MKTQRIRAAIAAVSLLAMSGSALACGESLFRVGKGVSFREYTAPLPGSILVVANTEAELALVERLAAAGHDITVVSGSSQIGEKVATQRFDVVLAYFSDRAEVESQISSFSATYIPVAVGRSEESHAKSDYKRSLRNDDSVKTFLKTIHRTLKDKA
ncbi:MAG: hypothetical protein AAFN50_05430 [Pseudomonadota bacterium]